MVTPKVMWLVLEITLLVGIGTAVWVEASGDNRFTSKKEVCVKEVGNGFVVRRGIQENFYHDGDRIARDAQGASAEVWAYLSGKKITPDWRE